LPKFQTGEDANYTNDISGLLSMKIIGISLFGLLKIRAFLVDNSTSKFFSFLTDFIILK
jgi:hypothetical protein